MLGPTKSCQPPCLLNGGVGGLPQKMPIQRSFEEMTMLLLEVPGKDRMAGKDLGVEIREWPG